MKIFGLLTMALVVVCRSDEERNTEHPSKFPAYFVLVILIIITFTKTKSYLEKILLMKCNLRIGCVVVCGNNTA